MGVIPLQNTKIDVIKKEENACVFSITHPFRKTFYLAAPDSYCMDSWIHSITISRERNKEELDPYSSFISTLDGVDISENANIFFDERQTNIKFCILKDNILYFLENSNVKQFFFFFNYFWFFFLKFSFFFLPHVLLIYNNRLCFSSIKTISSSSFF